MLRRSRRGSGGSRLVGFLEAGEVLGPAALLTLVAEGVSSGTRLVYSDHDAVEPTGRHVRPWFIPDWSPDRFLGQDYVGGFYLARDERLNALVQELAGAHEAWRYELLLRLADDGSGIAHVPKVLWSRPADAATSVDRPDLAIDWQRVADRRDPIDDADPASGVNLVGFIRAEMGVGEATRAEAQALTDADIPFVVIDVTTGNPARMRDLSWSHKVVDEPVFATNILHLNADVLSSALAPSARRPQSRASQHRLLDLGAARVPAALAGRFRPGGRGLGPHPLRSGWDRSRATKPVRVVPLAVRRARGPFLDRAAFGLPTGTYQFLAMYDTQSVMERKNPTGAIDAFKQAFAPDDSTVSLVVKVNSPGDPELKALSRLAGAHANIRIVGRVLSRDETDSLIACSDAFISLHRSEGFGFPIAEAMAAGKPVIATAWSGNMDFMSEDTAACVGYRLVTLERDYGPYEKGQRWAEPDLDDAAAWMRRLRDDPELGRRMGQRAATSIAASNSSWRIGALITEALALPSPASRSMDTSTRSSEVPSS